MFVVGRTLLFSALLHSLCSATAAMAQQQILDNYAICDICSKVSTQQNFLKHRSHHLYCSRCYCYHELKNIHQCPILRKFIEETYTTEKLAKPESKELLAKQQEAYQTKWKQVNSNNNDPDDEAFRMYFPRLYAYQ